MNLWAVPTWQSGIGSPCLLKGWERFARRERKKRVRKTEREEKERERRESRRRR